MSIIHNLKLQVRQTKMQSMVNRWKDKLITAQQKSMTGSGLSAHPPKPDTTSNQQYHSSTNTNQNIHLSNHSNINMKKSIQKLKKSTHYSQDQKQREKEKDKQKEKQRVLSSKKIMTPSKKKNKSIKSQLLQKYTQQILQIFAKANPADKNIISKIKMVLQQLWDKCIQLVQIVSPPKNSHYSLAAPSSNESQNLALMKESTLSSGTSKKQEKLYQDLQKRYFQCQKQKHFYKNKIQQVLKKYQNVEKQLQTYGKMEKLVEKCIQRQQETRQQNKKLKQELHISELKNIQQQKLFQQQITSVKQLMNDIKKNLPLT